MFIKAEMEGGGKWPRRLHIPNEPNAQPFQFGADSLLGRLSICPLGAESIGYTTEYKVLP